MIATPNELILNRLDQLAREPRNAHCAEELRLASRTILRLEEALRERGHQLDASVLSVDRLCERLSETIERVK